MILAFGMVFVLYSIHEIIELTLQPLHRELFHHQNFLKITPWNIKDKIIHEFAKVYLLHPPKRSNKLFM